MFGVMLKNNINPIVIATHPRSGTHLTIDLIRKQFRECQVWLWPGETVHHSYFTLDILNPNHPLRISQKQALNLLSRTQRPTIKTHCLPAFEELGSENIEFVKHLIKNGTIYYVVRDGRDVLCSTHTWMKCFDPKARCSLSEFMRQNRDGMSMPRFWANHVLSWMNDSRVRVLKFEDIVKDTLQVLVQISTDLGIKPLYKEPLLPKRRKSGSQWEDYWLRLTRQYESSTIHGRYNDQKPEKWQSAFSIEDRNFFHQEAGEALIKLGYVESDAWIYE